jgi:hypothetical protein
MHLYHGLMPDTRVGMTFGHEFIGVVEQVGPSVRNLQVGDRVMVPFNIFCGTCWYCARGLYSNCHNVNPNATAVGGIYGYSHTCGGYDGGQAEYVRVPFADVGPSRIPDWMDDEDALLCTDALATGYFGAQLGGIVEQFRDDPSGAHWELPERQPETWPRERSVEHAFLTPVFGTACPPRGVSGAIRKLAYARYSEARAAHWLLLIAADRVDAWENHLRSFATLRPDNPITETGVLSEFSHHGIASRIGRNRADLKHQTLDPIIVAGPWLAVAGLVYSLIRSLGLWAGRDRDGARASADHR